MRPRVSSLRTKYRECVSRLKATNIPVSLASVSANLSIPFGTVRNFMYRNPVLAKELGLATREHHTSHDYIEAAKALDDAGKRITTYVLAAALGRDHSGVARFLRNNRGTHVQIYRETGQLVGWSEVPKGVRPKKIPSYLMNNLLRLHSKRAY